MAKFTHRWGWGMPGANQTFANQKIISDPNIHKYRPVRIAPIRMTPGNWFESDGNDANVAAIAMIVAVIWCNSLVLRRRQKDFLTSLTVFKTT